MEFENLKRVAKEELEKLNAAYANKSEFSEKDAEMYKCLMSGLKDQLAIEGMTNYNEMEMGPEMSGENGMSGRMNQPRAMNGRFKSMDSMETAENQRSFDRGYSQGYSAAMEQNGGMSGHYPTMWPPRPRY